MNVFFSHFKSKKMHRKYNKERYLAYCLIKQCILPPISFIITIAFISYLVNSAITLFKGNTLTIQLAVGYLIFIMISTAYIIVQLISYLRPSSPLSIHKTSIGIYINSSLLLSYLVLYNMKLSLFVQMISKSSIMIALNIFVVQLSFVYFYLMTANELISLCIIFNLLITVVDDTINRISIQVYLILLVICSYFLDKKIKADYIRRFNDETAKKREDKMLSSKTNVVMKIENGRFSYVNQCLCDFLLKKSPILQKELLAKDQLNNREKILEILNTNCNDILFELMGDLTQNNLTHRNSRSKEIDLVNELYQNNNKPLDILKYLKDKYLMKKHKSRTQYISVQVSSIMFNRIKYKYFLKTNAFTIIFDLNQAFNDHSSDKSKKKPKLETLFVSKIAHEFKNPLIAINELLDSILETQIETPLSDQQKKYFNLIQSFTLYLFTLAKDIESYSEFHQMKKIQLCLSTVNINDTIKFVRQIANGLISQHSNNKKISFDVIIDSTLPSRIYTDETRLRQILINLISNSIKFTDQGSIILHLSDEDESIKFSVTDTGKGIDNTLKRSIFLPFEKIAKNNSVGSGLGLCIVRELSLALGQEIQFTSHLNHGSTFWFLIPLIDKNGKLIKNETEYENEKANLLMNNSKGINTNTSTPLYIERQFNKKLSNFSSDKTISVPLQSLCHNRNEMFQSDKSVQSPDGFLNILIVDDEELVRKASIRSIKEYAIKNAIPIDIIEASDGFEAIGYLCKSNPKKIDLIICDENMKYCNGLECFSYLNKLIKNNKLPRIPFVILSGNFANTNTHSLNSKVKLYVKPINETIVQSLLNEINSKAYIN